MKTPNASEPAKKGRPTKFNDDVASRIINAVKAGNYLEAAAAFAGISKGTLYDWMRTGTRSKAGKLKAFSDAVEQAMGEAEVRHVLKISEAAKNDWKAAAWHLERKHHKRWGRKDSTTLKGDAKKPVHIQHGLHVKVTQANVVDPKTGRVLAPGEPFAVEQEAP